MQACRQSAVYFCQSSTILGDGDGGRGSTHLKNCPILCFVKIYQRLSLAYADRQTDIQREDVEEFETCPQWTRQECHSALKLYFEALRRVRTEIEVFV